MKKLFILLVIPILAGCDMFSDLTKIPLPVSQSIDFPITKIANDSITINTPEVNTGIESVLSTYSITTDLIQEVKFNDLKITTTGNDLTYLKKVEIYITSDSLVSKKIAWIDEFSSSPGKSVSLNVTTDDLKSYLLKNKFGMMIKVWTDELISTKQTLNLEMNFTLDVKLLGM